MINMQNNVVFTKKRLYLLLIWYKASIIIKN